VDVQTKRVAAGKLSNQATADGLEQDEHVDSHADAVVGIGQVARRADRKEAQHENDGGEADGEDLKVGMVANGAAWLAGVVPGEQHGKGYDEEERYRGKYAMAED
jgi:hypothetical protein